MESFNPTDGTQRNVKLVSALGVMPICAWSPLHKVIVGSVSVVLDKTVNVFVNVSAILQLEESITIN